MATERKHDRVHLSFDVVGSQDGDKSPIICLHGMTSAKEAWQNVARPISEATGRKVYAYDARNHGDSGWSDKCDYDSLTEDLLQFMDCIHSQKAVLVGHSMGGKTAMMFATKWPERVEKLVVEDISPKPSAPHLREGVIMYVHLLQDAVKNIPPDVKDLQRAKKSVYEFMHGGALQERRGSSPVGTEASSRLPLYQDDSGQFKWKTNLKAIEDYLLNIPKRTDVTGSFSVPTLVLYGTKSPYKVSADRDFIKRVFPEAELRAIGGATHQIHEEYGDIFVKEVVDFINDS